MRLHHAEITGVRVQFPPSVAVTMTIVVDVYNPNSYDVAIRAMRGQAILAERYPLPMDLRFPGEGIWLYADRTTPVRVPIAVPVEIGVQLMREALFAAQIPFRFVGKADVTATRSLKIESDDYSVDERGWISRQQIEAALRGGY